MFLTRILRFSEAVDGQCLYLTFLQCALTARPLDEPEQLRFKRMQGSLTANVKTGPHRTHSALHDVAALVAAAKASSESQLDDLREGGAERTRSGCCRTFCWRPCRHAANKCEQAVDAATRADVDSLNDFSVSAFLGAGVSSVVLVSLLIARSPAVSVLFAHTFSRACLGVVNAAQSLVYLRQFVSAMRAGSLSSESMSGLRHLSGMLACVAAWSSALQVVWALVISKERTYVTLMDTVSLEGLLWPYVASLASDATIAAAGSVILGLLAPYPSATTAGTRCGRLRTRVATTGTALRCVFRRWVRLKPDGRWIEGVTLQGSDAPSESR